MRGTIEAENYVGDAQYTRLMEAMQTFMDWATRKASSSAAMEAPRANKSRKLGTVLRPDETALRGSTEADVADAQHSQQIKENRPIRFSACKLEPRALNEYNYICHLAKLARKNRSSGNLAYEIFEQGLEADQEKNVVIKSYSAVVSCVKRGFEAHPNRESLFKSYCDEYSRTEKLSESEQTRIRICKFLMKQQTALVDKFKEINVPMFVTVDCPYNQRPTVLGTEMHQRIDNYLIRHLGSSMADIALILRRSDMNAIPEIHAETAQISFDNMNIKEKKKHLKSVLFNLYCRDCKPINNGSQKIPWDDLIVIGWPKGVKLTLSNLHARDYNAIYDAYKAGKIIFTNK